MHQGKTIAYSSTKQDPQIVGPAGDGRRYVFFAAALLFFLLSASSLAEESTGAETTYFNIPQQRADLSLTQFAEQADLTLIFRFKSAKDKTANKLEGEYSVADAIEILLDDTGLKPVFSDQGLLMSVSDKLSDPEGDQMNAKKTTGLLAVFATVFGATPAMAQDTENVVEEIVVTGVRASFARSLDQKRASTSIYDAIVAEDIGEFPDLNISESLQRIPGVSITRNLGEGEQVSVRGLAPQFTGVLINGMQAASAAQGDDGNISYGRALTFDLFPSELFTGAGVYKTPTASIQDGGLSATIDMKVPRPFDHDGFTFASTVQASENDLTDETQPALSFLISNTSSDGKIGGLLQVAYAETLLHGELAEGLRFDKADFDLDGDGTPEYTDTEYARLVRTGVEEYDRDRIGLTGSL